MKPRKQNSKKYNVVSAIDETIALLQLKVSLSTLSFTNLNKT